MATVYVRQYGAVQVRQTGENSMTFTTRTFSRTFHRTVGEGPNPRMSYLDASNILQLRRLQRSIIDKHKSLSWDGIDGLRDYGDTACNFMSESNRLHDKMEGWIAELRSLDEEATFFEVMSRMSGEQVCWELAPMS